MRYFVVLFLLTFFVVSKSWACDFSKLSFGDAADKIVDQYNIDVLEVSKTGEFVVAEMGDVVCTDLPKNSIIEFTFIDNVFVKVHISNPILSEQLLNYAKSIFGENDDKDRKKDKNGITNLALWNNDELYSVIYSVVGSAHEKKEVLAITSKKHDRLFGQMAEKKGKAMDEYLKSNKLGKYSSSYSAGSVTSDDNIHGDIDSDSIDEMKEKFDKSQEEYRKRNVKDPKKGRVD